jgi:uncharacterized protein
MKLKAEYLFDVNALLALLSEDHIHHQLMTGWLNDTDPQWSICAFTEAGFLRTATAPRPGKITMMEAAAILESTTRRPGYHYLAVDADFQTLCSPFFARLYGTKQVTDVYLLGLAVRQGLVLVTMDKGILRLAGKDYGQHVLLLEAK